MKPLRRNYAAASTVAVNCERKKREETRPSLITIRRRHGQFFCAVTNSRSSNSAPSCYKIRATNYWNTTTILVDSLQRLKCLLFQSSRSTRSDPKLLVYTDSLIAGYSSNPSFTFWYTNRTGSNIRNQQKIR